MITTQLNHERVGLAAWSGLALQLCDEVAAWAAAQATDDGRRLVDQPWVQADLARVEAELEAMRLLNWRMAASVAAGTLTPDESSSIKVFGTERTVEVYRLLLGIVGAAGYLAPGSPGAAPARPPGGVGPPGPDQHLRRRGERGPARDRGHRRPRHAPGGAVSGAAGHPGGRDDAFPDHGHELAALVGAATGPPLVSPVAVNQAMIHHWVEAMGDEDPVYVSDEAARAVGLPAGRRPADHAPGLGDARASGPRWSWSRPGRGPAGGGLAERADDGAARRRGTDLGGGHQLRAALRAAPGGGGPPGGDVGDRGGLRRQAHGPRHRAVRDHPHRLRGRARQQRGPRGRCGRPRGRRRAGGHHAVPDPEVPPGGTRRRRRRRRGRAAAAPRPRAPGRRITQDNAFLFEGARRHRLLTQRCTACGTLRHPPLPACAGPAARSSGTRWSCPAGASSTASWWSTTPRCRRSTTRCPSGW